MTKKELILTQLKEEILTLKLKPGTALSETMLSEQYGLSRTPIRDILKQLSSEGYIDIYPQRGSVVSYIDLNSVEQIIYLRSTLEREILKSLCGHVSLQGIHNLQSILLRQKDCIQDMEAFLVFDDLFHAELFKLAGREFLWNVLMQFIVHYARYRRLHMLQKDKLLAIYHEHESIVEHIVGNHPDAIESIVEHHLKADVKSHYFQEHYRGYLNYN